ncbi:MAG: hypothetical protein ACREH4_11065 [Vitreimonas sp.]
MRRGQVVTALVVSLLSGCDEGASHVEDAAMPSGPPEKIRLIPDEWHIHNVGRLADGRLFLVDSQLHSAGGATTDFVCTYVFDQDGRLVEHSVELIGVRGVYPEGSVGRAIGRHLAALGDYSVTDVWVRPFSVESRAIVFGLIPRQTDSGEWRVEFMPGNTLSFYAPWEFGEYDT